MDLKLFSFVVLVYREKARKKLCFVSVFFVSFKIFNHGSCRGNTACALAQWLHLVALHETKDAVHRAMCIAPYSPGGMVIKIVIDLATFFIIVNSMFAHNHS
jgi:hypothetical protein